VLDPADEEHELLAPEAREHALRADEPLHEGRHVAQNLVAREVPVRHGSHLSLMIHAVPALEIGPVDPLTVDEGPVGRTEILQHIAALGSLDQASVSAARPCVVDARLRLFPAPDDRLLPALRHREHPPDARAAHHR